MTVAEWRKESKREYQKSQSIRILDVFVIAPVLIYAGTHKSLPVWLRYSLIGVGVATAYYNGKNYLVNNRNDQKQLKK